MTIATQIQGMPSALELWISSFLVSTPLLLGFYRRWIAWLLIPLAFAFSLWHGGFLNSFDFQWSKDNMGLEWTIHFVISAFVPFVLAMLIAMAQSFRSKA